MNNDAIVFDLDGTLWNASVASAKGYSMALAKLDIDKKITPKQIEGVSGKPNEECIKILLPGLIGKYPALPDQLDKYEIGIIKSEGGKFYDGVIEGIPKLASEYKLFIVSNCQAWYLDLFLELSNLKKYLIGFDCNGTSGQPKNEMLLNIKSNYSLNNPVYIGDTAGDENAANLANMEFIHVSYGFGKTKNETKKFDSFTTLLDYFSSKNISHSRGI